MVKNMEKNISMRKRCVRIPEEYKDFRPELLRSALFIVFSNYERKTKYEEMKEEYANKKLSMVKLNLTEGAEKILNALK